MKRKNLITFSEKSHLLLALKETHEISALHTSSINLSHPCLIHEEHSYTGNSSLGKFPGERFKEYFICFYIVVICCISSHLHFFVCFSHCSKVHCVVVVSLECKIIQQSKELTDHSQWILMEFQPFIQVL